MQASSPLTEQSISLITGETRAVTAAAAWTQGTNLLSAIKHHPKEMRLWLMVEVGKLCRDIDANKTLQSDEELQFCCRSILEEFPAIKVEEVRLCFDMIRQGKMGKLYERLKTPEIMEALRKYEGDVRAPIMEREQHNAKHLHVELLKKALGGVKEVREAVDKLKIVEHEKPHGSGLGQRVKKRLGTDGMEE